jgi:hypothetical protein
MMQYVQQRQNVPAVLALLRCADVIYDHVSNFLWTMFLISKVLSESGSGDLRQMLMLGYREHLFLC